MSGPRAPEEKVHDTAGLLDRFGRPRSTRVVFTNGCFDILHRGHVSYLHRARLLGDALVVGVNSDRSVRALKGPDRPLVGQEERVLLIASLEAVDAVTLFDEDTPRELIAALLPDILVNGGDYPLDRIVGRDDVVAAGGEVLTVPLVEGASTTRLIERIRTREST